MEQSEKARLRLVAAMQKRVDAQQRAMRRGFAELLAAKTRAAWIAGAASVTTTLPDSYDPSHRPERVPALPSPPPAKCMEDELHDGCRRISISRQTWRHGVLNKISPPGVPADETAASIEAIYGMKRNQEASSSEEHESDESDEEGWQSPHSQSSNSSVVVDDNAGVTPSPTIALEASMKENPAHKGMIIAECASDPKVNAWDPFNEDFANPTIETSEQVQHDRALHEHTHDELYSRQHVEEIEVLRSENAALQMSFQLYHESCEKRLSELNAILLDRDRALIEARCMLSEKESIIKDLRAASEAARVAAVEGFDSEEEAKTKVFVRGAKAGNSKSEEEKEVSEELWSIYSEDAILKRLDGILGPESAEVLDNFNDKEEDGEAPNRGEMSSNLEQLVAMADLF